MLRSLVLYTALALGANAVGAADLKPLRQGAMDSLVVYESPLPVQPFTVTDEQGATHSLEDYRGKVVLLNFWATWCPPCREEMPDLNTLQKELGGPDFQVVTIASGGANSPTRVKAFFDKINVDALPRFYDPDMTAARAMGVFGLPVSVLIDRDSREIARMIGGANWASPDARKVIEALIRN